MQTQRKILPCRTCGEKFVCSKTADEPWTTAFIREPPSEACRAHAGSALCRWETHKAQVRRWRKLRPAFDTGQPHAFVTTIPPRRFVPFTALSAFNLENEKRAMRRVLQALLPRGTKAVAIFDISLIDDHTKHPRERWWAPHFHILIVGMTADEVKALGRWPYGRTDLVSQPVRRSNANGPQGALF